MMHYIPSNHTLCFVVIPAARVQVAIETREVAARNLDPDAMTGFEVIAGRHRLQRHFVDLARITAYCWFAISGDAVLRT